MATEKEIREFQKTVWDYYKKEKRELPWRPASPRLRRMNPYEILVSELMLQQTQVDRVIPKYNAFLKKFPTAKKLANAEVSEVLKLWSGLGYNRRALFLKKTAEKICEAFPRTVSELEKLPGIGPYTARAISVFAFENREVFIETNIRTVFIYFFFKNKEKVSDTEILKLVEKTLPQKNIRDWYYALMDYGTYLKKTKVKVNAKSAHYDKQSKFKGSLREIRGAILKILVIEMSMAKSELIKKLPFDTQKIETQLLVLQKEGFLILKNNTIQIK